MIEKLVYLYYTDGWERFSSQGLNQFLYDCLQTVQSSIQPELWDLLDDEWFHDAYMTDLTCAQSNGTYLLRLSIEKEVIESRKIVLEFSGVSLFQTNGNILDMKVKFPHPCNKTPIAQILDIWVEKNDNLTCCILFDNARSLYMRCDRIKLL